MAKGTQTHNGFLRDFFDGLSGPANAVESLIRRERSTVSVEDANLSPQAKTLANELIATISAAKGSTSGDVSSRLDQDLRTLVSELKTTRPMKRRLGLALEGIRDSAAAIGIAGAPIVTAANALESVLT